MPTPTVATRHAVNRDPIRDAYVILLEFQEDGASTVLRAAVNNEDLVYAGNTYTRSAIQVSAPSTDDNDASASLTVSNVDRQIGRALDACRRRISVRMMVIDTGNLAADPVIDTRNLMVIPSASGNTEAITAQLGPRADQQEPVPFQRTTKGMFPGVWIA